MDAFSILLEELSNAPLTLQCPCSSTFKLLALLLNDGYLSMSTFSLKTGDGQVWDFRLVVGRCASEALKVLQKSWLEQHFIWIRSHTFQSLSLIGMCTSKSPHFYNPLKIQNTQFQLWSPQTRLCFHIPCQSHSAKAKKKQGEKRLVREFLRFHTSPFEARLSHPFTSCFCFSKNKVPTSVCALTEIEMKVFLFKKKRRDWRNE